MVPHNVFADLAFYFPIGKFFSHVREFSSKRLVEDDDTLRNVDVALANLAYFTPDRRNQTIGDQLFGRIRQLVKRRGFDFDIVQGHFTWPTGYAAVRIAREFNVPSVIYLHESQDWLLEMLASKNPRFRWAWGNADALVRVNKRDIPMLQSINRRVLHIPGGFDPIRFCPMAKDEARERIGLPSEGKVLFTLGAHEKRKGFEYLIEAMVPLVEQFPDLHCLIGGSGPYTSNLQKVVRRLGVGDHITFSGQIPSSLLASYYNAANLFVLPSLSEGNPTVMFESLGCGIPFVGTAVGGVREVITSDNYGLLVQPRDSNGLGETIALALNRRWDKDLIRGYSLQYSWESNARSLSELYGGLLGVAGAARGDRLIS